MKAKALIMILFIGGLAVTSNAQTKTIKTKNQPAAFSPVQKGYYTIGRNMEKLNTSSELTMQETNADVPKGYYAIGKNRNKIPNQKVAGEDGTQNNSTKRTWPVKGYYGIGKNAEKL